MPSELESILQDDFSRGMQRDVAPHLIDRRAAFDIVNGLVDDDGSIYKRGGSVYKSGAAFGTSLRFLWDGYLKPGRRTFFANTADFGVLDANDSTVLNLGGSGRTFPLPPAELRGVLFLPGGAIYGGSRKTAAYSTGTVTTTLASKTLTGAGTTWTTNVDAGMLFRVGAERVYVVESVDSNTQITLEDAYEGTTGAGKAYALSILLDNPGAPYNLADHLAVCADRLCWGFENQVRYGTPDNPHAAWNTSHFQELPGGVRVVGLATVGQVLVVFTTGGIFTLHGLAYTNPADTNGNPQHRSERLSSDLLLWGSAGIATWENALVAPCLDGVYLIDGVSQPRPIAHFIERLYREYVTAGYRPGQAVVYRGHYLLPILSPDGGTVHDLLVCRLDRPAGSRGALVYPWTRLDDAGAQVSAFATRTGDTVPSPILLGALATATARVGGGRYYFLPAGGRKSDADGTTPTFKVITRDYELAAGTIAALRRARARYELVDAAADSPALVLAYSDGSKVNTSGSVWGVMTWGVGSWAPDDDTLWVSVQGTAQEDEGLDPYTWHINRAMRYVRFRLQSSGPSAKLNLRSLEVVKRPPHTRRR